MSGSQNISKYNHKPSSISNTDVYIIAIALIDTTVREIESCKCALSKAASMPASGDSPSRGQSRHVAKVSSATPLKELLLSIACLIATLSWTEPQVTPYPPDAAKIWCKQSLSSLILADLDPALRRQSVKVCTNKHRIGGACCKAQSYR